MIGPHIYYNPCYNPSLTSKNELTREILIKNYYTSIAATFQPQIPTPTPTQNLVFTLVLTLASIPTINSINKLCWQLIKIYAAIVKLLDYLQSIKPCERPFKAQFPNFYYRNLHLNCYCFYQYYKYDFEIVGPNKPNQIFFDLLFFCKVVVQQWYQYKYCSKVKDPITLSKFKNFS